tara:strand:+ start:241 stop:549 length:309 start_codon:yes stop_codon:yes gene_type:complete
MTNLTQDEREEANYIIWEMNDGPAKKQAEHKALALTSLEELPSKGWKVLSTEMVGDGWFGPVRVLEAVIRSDRELKIIHWHTGNKGWMERHQNHGGSSSIKF